jgi:hypothetical protein
LSTVSQICVLVYTRGSGLSAAPISECKLMRPAARQRPPPSRSGNNTSASVFGLRARLACSAASSTAAPQPAAPLLAREKVTPELANEIVKAFKAKINPRPRALCPPHAAVQTVCPQGCNALAPERLGLPACLGF